METIKTFAAYTEAVLVTAKRDISDRDSMINFAMGLFGEAGELVDEVKKILFHDKPVDIDLIRKECGDFGWYLFALADVLGLSHGQWAGPGVIDLDDRAPQIAAGCVFGASSRVTKWHESMSLARYVGVLCGEIDNAAYEGRTISRSIVLATIQCSFWSLSVLAHQFGLSMSEIATANIAKLRKRHGDGFKVHGEQKR